MSVLWVEAARSAAGFDSREQYRTALIGELNNHLFPTSYNMSINANIKLFDVLMFELIQTISMASP